MKLVKLNKTHHLFQYGYTHALRFGRKQSPGAQECLNVLVDSYGIGLWECYRSSPKSPFWIGVKDESILTFLFLKVDLPK